MRKIILFISLMFATMMVKAQVSFVYEGREIARGEQVEVLPNDDEAKFSPAVKNSGDNAYSAVITVKTLQGSDILIQSVCTGLLCKSDSVSAPFDLGAGEVYDQAYVDFYVPDVTQSGLYEVTVEDNATNEVLTSLVLKVKGSGVGIDEVTSRAISRVYPNPTNDRFVVGYSVAQAQGMSNAYLTVYDMKGAVVACRMLDSANGDVWFDVRGWSKGMYTCVVADDNRRFDVQRIVVR